EGYRVDVGDGGEGRQVEGAGGIEPQRVDGGRFRRSVDGLAGCQIGDRADDEDVRAETAGQGVRTGSAGDGVDARSAIDGVDARAAVDDVVACSAGDGVGAAEIGADHGDAVGSGQACGADRHGI